MQGAFQYFFYTKVLVWVTNPITRTMGHIASAPAKTFVDQAIHHPFMYFPSFYVMKYTLVGGDSMEVAMARYQDELWTNCNALWKLWVPCQVRSSLVQLLLQYQVAPPATQEERHTLHWILRRAPDFRAPSCWEP
jgi:hypothetical protein